jgi:hypothetical protein
MKFAVFCGDYYYPAGGWGDFNRSFDTYDEAHEHVKSLSNCEWWEIVNLATLNVVAQGYTE